MLKFLGDKNSYVGASLTFASFLLSTLLFSLVNVSNVFAYTASLSTSGTVTTNVKPNSDGTTGANISTDSVNVITNCRAGYNLTISGPSDRNLYKDGNSSNNTSGQYFTPVDGTSQLNHTTSSDYSYDSYLSTNGYAMWLLSPLDRLSGNSPARMFVLGYNLGNDYVTSTISKLTRPVISLSHSTAISGGSGTATDPWIVNAP